MMKWVIFLVLIIFAWIKRDYIKRVINEVKGLLEDNKRADAELLERQKQERERDL